jgi:hypothetical protein
MALYGIILFISKGEKRMDKIKGLFLGFKNAFTSEINVIEKDYPVYKLWEKSHKIENRFKGINEKTKKSIEKHIYTTY